MCLAQSHAGDDSTGDTKVQDPSLLLLAIPPNSGAFFEASSSLIQTLTSLAKNKPSVIPHILCQSTILDSISSLRMRGLAMTLYDKIPLKIKRRTSERQVSRDGVLQNEKDVKAFGVTLAGRGAHEGEDGWKAKFERREKASLGVGVKGCWLCVGYEIFSGAHHSPTDGDEPHDTNERRKWLVSCITDSLGESSNTTVWLCPSTSESDIEGEDSSSWIVRTLWDFMVQFIRDTDVEWRVCFSRLGVADSNEIASAYFLFATFSCRFLILAGWKTLLASALVTTPGFLNIRIWITCVEAKAAWGFPSPASNDEMLVEVPPAKGGQDGGIFMDTSSTTYLVSYPSTLHSPLKSTLSIFDILSQSHILPAPSLSDQETPIQARSGFIRMPSSPTVGFGTELYQMDVSLIFINSHPHTTLPPLDEQATAKEMDELMRVLWGLNVLGKAREDFARGFFKESVGLVEAEKVLPMYLSAVRRTGRILARLT